LLYCEEFKKYGFDVLHVLLLLADELSGHLDTRQWYLDFDSETYLLRKATELYCNRVFAFLYSNFESDGGLSFLLYRSGDRNSLRKIKEMSRIFKLRMLSQLKAWGKNEIHGIESLEKSLEH